MFPPASSAAGLQLQDLLSRGKKNARGQENTVSTRHGRFGTLCLFKSSGQLFILYYIWPRSFSLYTWILDKLDRTKWHKTSGFKYDSNDMLKNSTIYLNLHSIKIIKRFIELLLSSGSYNNLLLFGGSSLNEIFPMIMTSGAKGIPWFGWSTWTYLSYFWSFMVFFIRRDRNNYYARNRIGTPRWRR